MPDPDVFLEAFGLSEGTEIAGYRIIHVDAIHHSVVRWKEYSYHFVLTFEAEGRGARQSTLESELRRIARQKLRVKATRNYYECTLDPNLEIENTVHGLEVTMTGHADR